MRPHIIVSGNEKGGTGKSTVAMHVCVGLMRLGLRVATLDVDARQGTLSRYLENRAAHQELPMPEHFRVFDEAAFRSALSAGSEAHVILIDTPGHDAPLARLAHAHADTLITPLNDSFIDLDVMAKVDGTTRKIKGLSHYAEAVFEQRKRRIMEGKGGSVDWVVLRNRLSHLDARNKHHMAAGLEDLSKRIGFRLAPGFSERVIFRELFPDGLTMMDIPENSLTLSHLSARQEVRTLIETLGLPMLSQ